MTYIFMNYIKFTDLRNNAKQFFDSVESGTSYIVIRKGSPMAKISPFTDDLKPWKRSIKKIKLKKGLDTAKYISKEREEI